MKTKKEGGEMATTKGNNSCEIEHIKKINNQEALQEIRKGQDIAKEFSQKILESIYVDIKILKEPYTL